MTVDVLREEDFNNEEINIKNPSDSINKIIKEHNTFKKNDLVIHTEYGLGKFIGLESIEINGTKNDLIRIEYRNNAYLLVPVENCDSITKYSDYNESIKLDSLNSKNWSEKNSVHFPAISVRSFISQTGEEMWVLYWLRSIRRFWSMITSASPMIKKSHS